VQETIEMLERLVNAVDEREPWNASFCRNVPQPLLHLACSNKSLLSYAQRLTERARKNVSRSTQRALLLDSCLRQSGELNDTLSTFKEAAKIGIEEHPTEWRALYSQIHVKILLGQLEEASKILEEHKAQRLASDPQVSSEPTFLK
jgi:tetratricopeptide (TPR) repeat protein